MTSVLHVITTLSTGGAEHALFRLLAAGRGRAGRTAVVSLRDDGAFGDGLRALRIPVYSLRVGASIVGPRTIGRLRRCVQELEPDIIQGWMYHGNLAALLASWLAPGKPPVVWNVRQSLYDIKHEKRMTRAAIRVNRALSGRADAILYNSALAREQHEAFGFAERLGRVLGNGFDLDQLRPSTEARKRVRKTLGIPDSDLVVGHVARFHPMKDHAIFLRAAARVAETVGRARFLLAGRGVSLNNVELARFVPRAVKGRFLFLDERRDVPSLMRAMDAFCLTSWSESFPNVVGEAMATGVPCVVTDVGDTADIVGDTGIIVPPKDEDALVGALLTLLSKSEDARRALGQAARSRIESNCALPRVVRQYMRLYEDLAAKR